MAPPYHPTQTGGAGAGPGADDDGLRPAERLPVRDAFGKS
jgi:hypothetical protein